MSCKWHAARSFATDDWMTGSASREGWIVWSSDWRGITLQDAWGIGRLVAYDNSDFTNLEAAMIQVRTHHRIIGLITCYYCTATTIIYIFVLRLLIYWYAPHLILISFLQTFSAKRAIKRMLPLLLQRECKRYCTYITTPHRAVLNENFTINLLWTCIYIYIYILLYIFNLDWNCATHQAQQLN